MPIAIVVGVLIAASVLFHLLSPWYFTPIASNWASIDTAVDITFWVTGAVFVAVNSFMVYALVRYRQRKGSRAHYEPENAKLERRLTVWTAVGIAALLGVRACLPGECGQNGGGMGRCRRNMVARSGLV